MGKHCLKDRAPIVLCVMEPLRNRCSEHLRRVRLEPILFYPGIAEVGCRDTCWPLLVLGTEVSVRESMRAHKKTRSCFA